MSTPAVTFPKGKSPNHPKILHVQVANNQVRIPHEKRGNIKMPVSSYHGDKLLWGTTPAASRPGWTQTVEVTEETVRSPGVL